MLDVYIFITQYATINILITVLVNNINIYISTLLNLPTYS